MTNFNGFKGAAKRIEDIDLPRLGVQIGVGEDELHAFMDAETRGSGFDSQAGVQTRCRSRVQTQLSHHVTKAAM